MSTTIAQIASWVTTDVLKRNDLTTAATNAAYYFYKVLIAKIPFDELMQLSAEIPTVAYVNPGDEIYNLASLIPPLKSIADIRISFNPNTKRRLRRSHARVYDALSFSVPSRPATYARWGLNIALNPPPNSSSYTFRVRYWGIPTLNDASPGTVTLATPQEWDELMRWETLYRVYNMIGQEQKAASLIQPLGPHQPSVRRQLMAEVGILPRLWNELLSTISQKENVDEDFGINPVVRAYSYRGK